MNSLSLNKSSINLKKSFYLFSYYFLAVLLLFTGIVKIIDPQLLVSIIKSLILVDQNLVLVVVTTLPVFEIALAIMLLLKVKIKTTLKIVTTLFIFFFLFSLYGFTVGLENDCGCFGNTIKSEFGIGMIIRNFLLLTITIYLTINSNKNPAQG